MKAIGETVTTISGSTVTIREIHSRNFYLVCYGFNSKGEDILGLIHKDKVGL